MIKSLSGLLLAASLFSCNENKSAVTVIEKAPVDSLIMNWSNGWNNHDSAGVRGLFEEDALLIDDNLVANSAKELSDKWISPNINVVSNFKATKMLDWSSADRAGYTGKYAFDAVVNDSIVAKAKGFFTVNWVKTGKGEWKITNTDIHSAE